MTDGAFDHSGSRFDEVLRDEDLLESAGRREFATDGDVWAIIAEHGR